MAGGWGSSKNGVRLGVFWDSITYESTRAKITDPRIAIDRDVNITDSTNSLSWSGGAVVNGSASNINVSGSGDERIKNVTADWIPRLYGQSNSASFAASMSNVNYAGGTLTVSKTVTVSARPYSLPAAPTLGAYGRLVADDSSENLQVKWTNNSTGGSTTPAPYTALIVERLVDDATVWTQVSADLASNTAAWIDYNTQRGHRYKYRVRAKNSAGTGGASAETAWIYTSPLEPTNVVAVKNGANADVGWGIGTAYLSGTSIIPERDGAPAAEVTVGAATVTWTDVAPNFALTQQYVVRHYIDAVPIVTGGTARIYSLEVDSNLLDVAGPPFAPTVSVAHSVLDVGTTTQTVNFVHRPIDGATQSKYQYQTRYSTDDGASYTAWAPSAEIAGAATSFNPPGLVNGRLYEVQVKTWSTGTATGGDWSAAVQFRTSGTPTATVSSPGSGTIGTPALTLNLSFTDPEGGQAAEWRIRLYAADGTTLIWPGPDDPQSEPGTIDDAPYTVPYPLVDLTTYKLTVQARDAAGLWSAVSPFYTYDVVFLLPPAGRVLLTGCMADIGASVITYYVPQPSSTEVAATQATIQRLTNGEWLDICAQTVPDDVGDPLDDPILENFFTNPRAIVNSTGWAASLSATTHNGARVTGATGFPAPVTTAFRLSVTASGASASGGISAGSLATTPVTVGQLYTFSAYYKSNFNSSLTPSIEWRTAGGALISTTTGISASMTSGTVYRASVQGTAPATAAYAVLKLNPPTRTWAVGNTLEASAAMLVEGFYDQAYFEDGLFQCIDRIPPLGGPVQYRIVTESATPTITGDDEGDLGFSVDCSLAPQDCLYPDGMAIFLNAGPDWATQAIIIGDPAVQNTVEREKVLVTPVGRTLPIELLGIAVSESYNLSGVVARDDLVPVYLAKLGALRDHWTDMALMPAPICYRDPFGKRIFCSISNVRTDWGTTPVSGVSATLTRVTGGA